MSKISRMKRHPDSGDLVESIIVVAFAVVAIAGVGLMGNTIMSKGDDAARNLSGENYVENHAELCEAAVIKKSSINFETVTKTLVDEPLDDGSHKVTVRSDSSYEDFGKNEIFSCVVSSTGEIISLDTTQPTETD